VTLTPITGSEGTMEVVTRISFFAHFYFISSRSLEDCMLSVFLGSVLLFGMLYVYCRDWNHEDEMVQYV